MAFTRTRIRTCGFTLTELAIVLGVIGSILGAIWVAGAQVYQNRSVTKATNQVMTILSGYQRLFGSRRVDTQPNWGDITSIGINAQFFPSDMISNNAASNPWNGSVTVYGDTVSNGIVIIYDGLPKYACIGLAIGVQNQSQIFGYSIGSSGWQFGATPFAASLSSTQISAYCNGAGNSNSVAFDFSPI